MTERSVSVEWTSSTCLSTSLNHDLSWDICWAIRASCLPIILCYFRACQAGVIGIFVHPNHTSPQSRLATIGNSKFHDLLRLQPAWNYFTSTKTFHCLNSWLLVVLVDLLPSDAPFPLLISRPALNSTSGLLDPPQATPCLEGKMCW